MPVLPNQFCGTGIHTSQSLGAAGFGNTQFAAAHAVPKHICPASASVRAPHELVEAVVKVLSGGKYISAGLAEKLATDIGRDVPRTPHERLSNREFQILRLMASGKSAKNIGQELSVSAQTVSTHRARILKKLGLKTTAALIRYAVENDLID